MGALLYVIFGLGTQLIASAPHSIVTVFDFTNCYAVPPVALRCERVAIRAGALIAALNAWCGLSASLPAGTPTVETSQLFRVIQ